MAAITPLSPEDADTALYFIRARGDVTRWCDWPQKRAAVIAAVPEVDDWMRAQRAADALYAAALKKLEELSG